MKHSCRKNFTLIEVVVALAILTLSLAGLLQLLSQSQLRIADAEERWMDMHKLIQATEYFLLAGDPEEPNIPDDFFPYPGYEINCVYDDAEGLPEDLENLTGQVPLKQCRIELIRTSDHKTVEHVTVDRFSYGENTNAE